MIYVSQDTYDTSLFDHNEYNKTFLFSVELSWYHFLLFPLIHLNQLRMAARITAYFIKKSLCCENYRTIAVETASIPIP